MAGKTSSKSKKPLKGTARKKRSSDKGSTKSMTSARKAKPKKTKSLVKKKPLKAESKNAPKNKQPKAKSKDTKENALPTIEMESVQTVKGIIELPKRRRGRPTKEEEDLRNKILKKHGISGDPRIKRPRGVRRSFSER